MNKPEDFKDDLKNLTKHIFPKIAFFFLGLYALEYFDQYGLSYMQFSEYDIMLKLIIIAIPVIIFATFAFRELGMKNYFWGAFITLLVLFLFIFIKPDVDPWKRCIFDYLIFIMGSYLGGRLITEAWTDFDKFRNQLFHIFQHK